MRNSVNKLFGLTLLVCGFVVEARATEPVVCLLNEFQVLGGTPSQSLYDGDRYEDGPTMCLDGPQFVSFTADSGKTTPQICPDCELALLVERKPPCGSLPAPFHIDHNFKQNMPKKSKTPRGTEWSPQDCSTVLVTRWVRLQTPSRTIPVKLYVVRSDIGTPKFGLSGEELKAVKHPVRTVLVGFEMAGYPAEVDPDALPVLQPKPWDLNPKCPTACTVQPDQEGQPFFVLTNRPVFPKEKLVGK